jgi:hypothetical protein
MAGEQHSEEVQRCTVKGRAALVLNLLKGQSEWLSIAQVKKE